MYSTFLPCKLEQDYCLVSADKKKGNPRTTLFQERITHAVKGLLVAGK